jgi:hypothetical protein
MAAALACASACLALAGCATPLPVDRHAAQAPAAGVLAGLSGYAAWLARQHDAQLGGERARLEAEPASVERDLRLALLHGLRTSSIYDPQLAAQSLIRIATAEPQTSVHGQLAQILFTAQPDPQACRETRQLTALSGQLAIQLTDAQVRGETLRLQLEAARRELEIERAERIRLESQLKALKSLEEQIKGRDQAGIQ